MRTLLLLFIFFSHIYLSAQISTHKVTLHYDTDKYVITARHISQLSALLDTLKSFENYKIYITGHTDDIAGNSYNNLLSARRAEAVKDHLYANSISPQVVHTKHLGEAAPAFPNNTDQGKAKNRRVEITVEYIPAEIVVEKVIQPKPDLYAAVALPQQRFCIDPSRDTTIVCDQGTVIIIKANSFQLDDRFVSGSCVDIKVKEAYKKSDMILENLTTTSDGKIIETDGMVFVNAAVAGKQVALVEELTILVPADSINDQAQIFDGSRTLPDSIMNWTVNENSVLGHFSVRDLMCCGNYWGMCATMNTSCKKCRLLLCRVKRFPVAIRGLSDRFTHYENRFFRIDNRICKKIDRLNKIEKENSINEYRLTALAKKIEKLEVKKEDIYNEFLAEFPWYDPQSDKYASNNAAAALDSICLRLRQELGKYGITDPEELFYAINKEIMDELGVKTSAEFNKALHDRKITRIEAAIAKKMVSFEDLKYYIFNTSRLGWVNVDIFHNYEPKLLTTLSVDVGMDDRTEIRIVFKDQDIVIAPDRKTDKYVFTRIPVNAPLWIVGIRYDVDGAQLGISEISGAEKNSIHSLEFENMTIDMLKARLRIFDQGKASSHPN